MHPQQNYSAIDVVTIPLLISLIDHDDSLFFRKYWIGELIKNPIYI
jgi:hypothetical protein